MAELTQEQKEWIEARPERVRLAIEATPPNRLYMLNGRHVVRIYSYSEPADPAESVTECTVLVLNVHNPNLEMERRVFGVKLSELEAVSDDAKGVGR